MWSRFSIRGTWSMLRVPATLSAVWRERLAARAVVSHIKSLLFDSSAA